MNRAIAIRSVVRPMPMVLVLALAVPAVGQRGAPSLSLESAADEMVHDAADLVAAVREELGGSPPGRRLVNLGEGLRGSAEAFRAAARARVPDPGRLRDTFGGVDRAAATLRQEMARVPGGAPRAYRLASRIDRTIDAIRPVVEIDGGRPLRPTAANLGYDPSRVSTTADELARTLDRTAERVEREVGYDYPYDRLARTLQGLSGQVHDLQHETFRSPPTALSALQGRWEGLERQARYADRLLEDARPPASVARAWDASRSRFNDMSRLLGRDATFGGGFNPGPDPVRPPVRPPVVDPTPSDQMVNLADQAIGQLDAFLLALRPQLLNVPEGFQFQADAQAVRAEMMGLRQALYASPRAASRAFRQAEATYTRLRARTERLGQGRDGPMINRVRAVGDVLNALRPALGGP
jgi:hypothetical protein